MSEKNADASGKQLSIDNMLKKGNDSYGPYHPEQIKATQSLVDNMIIGCSLPLSLVDNEFFHKFMHDFNPRYSLPSRSHLTSKVIPDKLEKKNGNCGKNDWQISSCCHNCGHMNRQAHAFILCVHRACIY